MPKPEEILIEAGAAKAAMIKYSDCKIINTGLTEKLHFNPKSVCIGIIPYYTHFCDKERTVSAYALAQDYHHLIKKIGELALEDFSSEYPSSNAAFFGDHSPIDEKHAAASAGLGIIGKHSLLITPEYSSYVFICELITDIEFKGDPIEIAYCKNCGACIRACPGYLRGKCECLSAITQKKGQLSDAEKAMLKRFNSAWGCDICQDVCPHTKRARASGMLYTDAPWFNQNIISKPSIETVNSDIFKTRAYSWRGKQPILRNIQILKEGSN